MLNNAINEEKYNRKLSLLVMETTIRQNITCPEGDNSVNQKP